MANGHDISSSVGKTNCVGNSTNNSRPGGPSASSASPDVDISSSLSTSTMIQDNLKLSWVGDLESLKSLVNEHLKLNGVWSSPGGEKKTFSSDDVDIIWLKKKKTIQFQGTNAATIIHNLMSTFTNGNNTVNTAVNDLKDRSQTERYCTCTCNELSTDLEGLKLDTVIAEESKAKK